MMVTNIPFFVPRTFGSPSCSDSIDRFGTCLVMLRAQAWAERKYEPGGLDEGKCFVIAIDPSLHWLVVGKVVRKFDGEFSGYIGCKIYSNCPPFTVSREAFYVVLPKSALGVEIPQRLFNKIRKELRAWWKDKEQARISDDLRMKIRSILAKQDEVLKIWLGGHDQHPMTGNHHDCGRTTGNGCNSPQHLCQGRKISRSRC